MTWQNFSHLVKRGFQTTVKHGPTRRFLWGVLFFAALTVILSSNFWSLDSLDVGQVAPKNIKAPVGKEFEDKEKTSQARERAARSVSPVYLMDVGISDRVLLSVVEFYKKLTMHKFEMQAASTQPPQARLDDLKRDLGFAVPDEVLISLLEFPPDRLAALEGETKAFLGDIYRYPGVTDELHFLKGQEPSPESLKNLPIPLKDAKDRLQERVNASSLDAASKKILNDTIPLFLKANAFYDEEATKKRIEEAKQSIIPVKITVRQGETIVREGDVVTAEQIKILQELGLTRDDTSTYRFFGMALLILICMGTLLLYLYLYRPYIFKDEKRLVLTGLLFSLTMVTAKGVSAIRFSESPETAVLLTFMTPVAAGSMLLTVLLDTRVATIATVLMSLLVGVINDGRIDNTLVSLMGGLAGVYSVSHVSQRSDLARAGLFVAVANILTILATGLLGNVSMGKLLLYGIVMGLVNGLLSSILMLGSLPYLESAFGLVTSIRLLELANPNQPLLKRLLVEAPGTYHHSLIVGNLAEAAAEAIGADPLLVRAGAYYHDIGKVKRPAFFIENQQGGENPHDKIAPSLSTLIITSHIADGGEMGREAKLPQPVIDIIEQHHGNTMVSYFYHKALENDRTESVNPDDYRYQAKKPQSREAAIVMLADTVEAAVRSMREPGQGKIEGTVRKLIKDKLHDGQLDECDLTFKDLETIAQAFVRVLCGISHYRIEYPDSMLKEMERRRQTHATVHSQ